MTNALKRRAAAAGLRLICIVGLAGCGGGSGSSGDGLTQQQREDAAASTWPGMLVFAQGQISGSTSEATEPRVIAGITPPQSDTTEPAPL
jgi:lysophospholipase L1-like esterase